MLTALMKSSKEYFDIILIELFSLFLHLKKRSFKEDVTIYMENCLSVDVANPEDWTGMEYLKAHNVPPESFIGIITMLVNENAKLDKSRAYKIECL